MFDKLKEMQKLQKIQSEVKKQLENIFVTGQKSGVEIVVRGDKKIERITIDGKDNKELKDLINNTMKDVDKKVEKQMRGHLSELGFPNL